jgi:FkbM family methyltransferase
MGLTIKTHRLVRRLDIIFRANSIRNMFHVLATQIRVALGGGRAARKFRSGDAIRFRTNYGFSIHCANLNQAVMSSPRFESCLRPHMVVENGTFIDVGANIGYWSLFVAARSPNVQIVACEMDEENLALLKKNLSPFMNQVKLIEAAISATDGELQISMDPLGRESSIMEGMSFSGGVVKRVPARSLDGMLKEFARVALIKIDVEGAEAAVLSGARQLIDRDRPRIVFEARTPQEVKRCEALLLNYQVRPIDETNWLAVPQ